MSLQDRSKLCLVSSRRFQFLGEHRDGVRRDFIFDDFFPQILQFDFPALLLQDRLALRQKVAAFGNRTRPCLKIKIKVLNPTNDIFG